ncbi:MAG: hypothetical protein JO363_07840 [Solirubrobacterales bacterium]|nr:hypothetical protein [Solirubrobacterales bacterium]
MKPRPPHLSPFRLLAGLALPWIAYLIVRTLTGSSLRLSRSTAPLRSRWR